MTGYRYSSSGKLIRFSSESCFTFNSAWFNKTAHRFASRCPLSYNASDSSREWLSDSSADTMDSNSVIAFS